MEVSGQLHAPAALIPGKERLVPIGFDVVIITITNQECNRELIGIK
jgi:hypothetical protein